MKIEDKTNSNFKIPKIKRESEMMPRIPRLKLESVIPQKRTLASANQDIPECVKRQRESELELEVDNTAINMIELNKISQST